VAAVLGRKKLRPADYRAAAALVTRMALGACGLGDRQPAQAAIGETLDSNT
jgi:hypothetical protein